MALWFPDDIQRIAQALILSNPDPNYRAGVIALAHALGARRLLLPTDVDILSEVRKQLQP